MTNAALTEAAARSDDADSFGRTAICMTGFARTLFAKFPDDVVPTSRRYSKDGRATNLKWWSKWAWAGSRKADGPPGSADWILAHALRHNVLDVLATHGGYDLFVVEPGEKPHDSRWSILNDATVSATGAPNQVFYLQGGAEPPIPYNEADPRWRVTFYYAANFTRIQQFLYQMRHLRICNEAVKAHEARTGVRYTYKMRLRPDLAWLKPIPPPHTLLGPANTSTLLMASREWQTGGNEDIFALGLSRSMDIFFDREPHVHTQRQLGCMTNPSCQGCALREGVQPTLWARLIPCESLPVVEHVALILRSSPCTRVDVSTGCHVGHHTPCTHQWTSEDFVVHRLADHRLRIVPHDAICVVVVRAATKR